MIRSRLLAAACFGASGVAGIAGLVAISSPAACSRDAAPAAFSPDPIVIGVSLGLSGSDFAATAGPLVSGVQLAEAQINSVGGLFGRQVHFSIMDDKSSSGPTGALQDVVSSFLDAGVSAMLGPIGSQQVSDIQMRLYDRQVLEISPSATSISLGDAQPDTNRFFFRTVPSDALQGKALALFATNRSAGAGADAGASRSTITRDAADSGAPPVSADAGDSGDEGAGSAGDAGTTDSGAGGTSGTGDPSAHVTCTNMAIVNIDNAYGTGFANAIASVFPQYGTIAATIPINANGQSLYTTQVQQLLDSHAQCVALIGYDDVIADFLRDLVKGRAMQPTALPDGFFIMGTDGVYDNGFLAQAVLDRPAGAPSDAEGIFGTSPDTSPVTPQYQEFRNLYTASFPLEAGADTPQFVTSIYDAAILTVLSIAQAGTLTDRVKIRDSLYAVSQGGTPVGPADLAQALSLIKQNIDIDYNGASGPCDFDSEGNVLGDYIVWRVKNAGFSTVSRVSADSLK